MKSELLDLLVCRGCRRRLACETVRSDRPESEEGTEAVDVAHSRLRRLPNVQAFYPTRETTRRSLSATGLREVVHRHRNGSSWTCLAQSEP
jgi:uncharacterized protein YbaR (Trm112 family)